MRFRQSFRLPGFRLEARQLKLERKARASGGQPAFDVGVDSGGEGFENLLRVGR